MGDEKETLCHSVIIRVSGLAQGIGFRPWVAGVCEDLGLRGSVANTGAFVEILAGGDKKACNCLIKAIQEDGPAGSAVSGIAVEEAHCRLPEGFFIEESKSADLNGPIHVPPDLAICQDCKDELHDASNRRLKHPFISCVSCGPRYTIIGRLPYDRAQTSMSGFELCESCSNEYNSRANRRRHAQTISCKGCGPQLLFSHESLSFTGASAFRKGAEILKNGGVLAVKGIGGYHLACLAKNLSAASEIRKVKGRESKPFAVMFPDIASIRGAAYVTPLEESLLESAAAPIVLLKAKKALPESICAGSCHIGAFLPYTPLHLMLTEEVGPIVLTSANISDSPIISDDEIMLSFAASFGIPVLWNKRRILRPIDDSVVKAIGKEPVYFRRGRGYVPSPIAFPTDFEEALAMGADLKSSFCFLKSNTACISQPLGDISSLEAASAYRKLLIDWMELFGANPKLVVCDKHPLYESLNMAKDISQELAVPLLEIQHHYAHIGSVMAENSLVGPIIGIAFDGAGYGTDGTVWGGEFLACSKRGFSREACLLPAKLLGGDSSSKDNAKTAFCYLHAAGLSLDGLDPDGIMAKAIDANVNTSLSSSMGRLFDAAAFLLGLCPFNRHEGEGASLLEEAAEAAAGNAIPPAPLEFEVIRNGILMMDYTEILKTLYCFHLDSLGKSDSQTSCAKASLALGFHLAVSKSAADICVLVSQKTGIKSVAFSGGCFQNRILSESLLKNLKDAGFSVYRNLKVSPNDGGIALGQAYLAGLLMGEGKLQI